MTITATFSFEKPKDARGEGYELNARADKDGWLSIIGKVHESEIDRFRDEVLPSLARSAALLVGVGSTLIREALGRAPTMPPEAFGVGVRSEDASRLPEGRREAVSLDRDRVSCPDGVTVSVQSRGPYDAPEVFRPMLCVRFTHASHAPHGMDIFLGLPLAKKLLTQLAPTVSIAQQLVEDKLRGGPEAGK